MIIENNFQRLYSICIQIISQIIFTTNGHSIPVEKLSKTYTHQKIEFTCNHPGENVIPAQRDVVLSISLELSIKEHIVEQ